MKTKNTTTSKYWTYLYFASSEWAWMFKKRYILKSISYLYCLFSAMVRKKYGKLVSLPSVSENEPSALYVITTELTCLEIPAIGSTVSEHAGPKMKDKYYHYTVLSLMPG